MGASVLLIPLAKSLLSIMVNRYMDKWETDATDGKFVNRDRYRDNWKTDAFDGENEMITHTRPLQDMTSQSRSKIRISAQDSEN